MRGWKFFFPFFFACSVLPEATTPSLRHVTSAASPPGGLLPVSPETQTEKWVGRVSASVSSTWTGTVEPLGFEQLIFHFSESG